jgi:predicted MFS family arabinose efflux permease
VYNPISGLAMGATAAGAGLATTGLNAVYAICAAFAVLAVSLAVIRIMPRFRRSH